MPLSFNAFDLGLLLAAATSGIAGYHAGLIRSLASILGYMSAAPVAVALSSHLTAALGGAAAAPGPQAWTQDVGVFLLVFLATGLVVGTVLRVAAEDLFGHEIHLADRLCGALLGALRVGLVAVAVIVVFDRMLPEERQPALLRASHLKPALSLCGRLGLRSLPPELAAQIDQMKKSRGI
jgi:membrane protein required for colicin V production